MASGLAWATLVVQIFIVVTGGAVRLTASGLGCPEWPTCDGSSIVNTPEMGIHGVIEFANRLLTFVLVIVAIVAFLSVWRIRKVRRDLFWLTLLIGLGIPAQAVIGGISVWTKLNPYVVGLHFVVSMALVVLSTIYVLRVRVSEPAPAQFVAPIIRAAACRRRRRPAQRSEHVSHGAPSQLSGLFGYLFCRCSACLHRVGAPLAPPQGNNTLASGERSPNSRWDCPISQWLTSTSRWHPYVPCVPRSRSCHSGALSHPKSLNLRLKFLLKLALNPDSN